MVAQCVMRQGAEYLAPDEWKKKAALRRPDNVHPWFN